MTSPVNMGSDGQKGGDLSDSERATLNAAMDIILSRTPRGASWFIGPANYHGKPECSVTYFDSSELKSQHSGLWMPDCTFADKIQMAITIEANLEATAEQRRAERIETLQRQLVELAGAPS